MTVFMAFWLGLVQGLTEFFPVSSSGHLVLLQHLFGIREPQLAFDVMVHLGTAAAVVVFTWQEIRSILSALAEIPRLLLRGELAEAFRENQGLNTVWNKRMMVAFVSQAGALSDGLQDCQQFICPCARASLQEVGPTIGIHQ